MGVFDFIKSAGERLITGAAAGGAAGAIAKRIREYNLGKDDLKVEDAGDGRIRVTGTASSQEEREKIIIAAGNVDGVAQVEDDIEIVWIDPPKAGEAPSAAPPTLQPPAPPKAETPSQFHTVERGDTLSAISKRYYGAAGKYMRIFEANKPMLSHPDKIYPGQVLRIPPLDA